MERPAPSPKEREISLREFLRKPEICGVVPGMSRASVRARLGAPEDYAAGHALERSPVWKYSGVELHFYPDSDEVMFLYADNAPPIAALEAGIAQDMTQADVEAELARREYAWVPVKSGLPPQQSALDLASGVRLTFDASDDENAVPRLYGFIYKGPLDESIGVKMKIIRARPDYAAALTRVAFAAKRHWGYPESWLEQWRDMLTISAEYICAHPTFVAVADDRILGFCAVQIEPDSAVLDHLWVLPEAMGRGVGRALFAHVEVIAREAGAKQLKIIGDPHAAGFYRRMGATVYGQEAAFMDGAERYLPLLEKSL